MQLGLLQKLGWTKNVYYKPIFNKRRFSHTYVIGKSGYGKSTFLENAALEDINNGEGIAFFDPHGSSIEVILNHIPTDRVKDVIVFDPSDRNFPIGFNPLHNISPEDIPFVASSILDTVKSVWKLDDLSTPYIDQYVYNGIAALLETDDGTLFSFKYLLTSKKYRDKVLRSVSDTVIKDFWETDFETMMPVKEQRTTVLSTLNKIGQLIADPRIRNIIGQAKSTIDFKNIIDNQKILLISLPQGKLGVERSSLVGALILSQIHLSALSRETDNPFHIFLDEAHRFGTSSLVEMLSGIRKFNVSLTLAHQYLGQLSENLKNAIFGTVSTMVAFRVGSGDAIELGLEMLTDEDMLVRLAPYRSWVRTDMETHSLDMPNNWHDTYDTNALKRSRKEYSTHRKTIEQKLKKFVEGT